MVLSPSAGSSHRVTGLKCIAMVSVPSGAAAARDTPTSPSMAQRIAPTRTRRETGRERVMDGDS